MKNKSIQVLDFVLIYSYPHDTNSLTEGFLIHDGKLYESSGAYLDFPQTKSLFGIVDLKTGKIETKVEIDGLKYFGEGIAFLNGKVFQLTYRTKVGFIYNANTFVKEGEFVIPGEEGWGLTTDGENLIMSDGTNKLTYFDPNDFYINKIVSVTENGCIQEYLNDLEYIKGFIYANVRFTNTIVIITPSDGKIIGKVDLSPLADEAKKIYSHSLEMNGIAYDPIADEIFVTGKFWPRIYKIKVIK